MILNRSLFLPLSIAALAALPLAAQTKPSTAAARRATVATHHVAGGCVTAPSVSPKIPALPATAPCVKTLYTVTRTPSLRLDYASPLVSEVVRQELGDGPETFSLDYVDTKAGSGEPVQAHKCLSVQYTGYLTDGTKFDSSRDRPGNQPIEFYYGGHQVIPGWDTGFEGMRMGGERRLFIPYQLAYGENGRGPIPAKAELIFDVQAVSQSDPHAGAPPGQQCMRAPMPPPQRPGMPPGGAAPKGATPPPESGGHPGAAPQSAPQARPQR
ncbi:MAG: FKBP-type peptidyl-prolyl cis-trans isomerase [Acidobacteriota bacterium]